MIRFLRKGKKKGRMSGVKYPGSWPAEGVSFLIRRRRRKEKGDHEV